MEGSGEKREGIWGSSSPRRRMVGSVAVYMHVSDLVGTVRCFILVGFNCFVKSPSCQASNR